MSDKKKTAVDLLLDKITDYEMGETLLRLIGKDEIDHIRKVGREQIIDAVVWFDDTDRRPFEIEKQAKHYISETYSETPTEKKYKIMKKIILDKISDLCSDFLYYDRKNDEDLSMEQLNESVKKGEITIDEMVEEFRKHLENTFKDL